MPAPHGKTPRKKTFLLRMTDAEDAHVRRRAHARGESINDAIVSLIQDDMPAPEQPRASPPAPTTDRPGARKGRPHGPRGSVEITWTAPEPPIEGQTSIMDDDQ